MPKATLTTKNGATVVIEGSEEEVQQILSRIENSGESAKPAKGNSPQRKAEKRLPSATDAILELNREGFFDKPKGLADIKQKLASQGMIYPVTTLSGVVLALVRKRSLGRVKEGARWAYVTR